MRPAREQRMCHRCQGNGEIPRPTSKWAAEAPGYYTDTCRECQGRGIVTVRAKQEHHA